MITKLGAIAVSSMFLLACTQAEQVRPSPERAKAEAIARHYLAENMNYISIEGSQAEFTEYIDAYEISFLPKGARDPLPPNTIRFLAYPTVSVRKSDGKILQAYITQ
jgi:hypothetical protein